MSKESGTNTNDTTRLNVEIPRDIHKEMKMQAVMDGCTVKDLVLAAIRKEYNI